MSNSVWVVIKYNINEKYDAESVGVYYKKSGAVNKILSLMKKDYDSFDDYENLYESLEVLFIDEDVDIEKIKWCDINDFVVKQLKTTGDCYGFYDTSYKINKHTIDQ